MSTFITEIVMIAHIHIKNPSKLESDNLRVKNDMKSLLFQDLLK